MGSVRKNIKLIPVSCTIKMWDIYDFRKVECVINSYRFSTFNSVSGMIGADFGERRNRKKIVYIAQLVISVFGFLIYAFFSGIVGSYVIEYKKNPTIIDKTLYAFDSSSYPLIACAFLLWAGSVTVMLLKKRYADIGYKSDR